MRQVAGVAPVLGCVMTVLVLSGCIAQPSPVPTIPKADDLQLIDSFDQVERPIDAYMPTAREIMRLVDEHEVRMNECLAEQGLGTTFSYPSDEETELFIRTNIRDRVVRSDVWGFFDTKNVNAFGYQRDPATELSSISLPPLPPEAQETCRLEDEVEPLLLTIEAYTLPDGGPTLSVPEETMRQLTEPWRICMRDAGYTYDSPLEPLNEFMPESKPSQKQITTAQADVNCKVETNFVGVAVAVLVAHDNAYIEKNEAALVEMSSMLLGRTGQ